MKMWPFREKKKKSYIYISTPCDICGNLPPDLKQLRKQKTYKYVCTKIKHIVFDMNEVNDCAITRECFMCSECFTKKLIPWLEEQGVSLKEKMSYRKSG